MLHAFGRPLVDHPRHAALRAWTGPITAAEFEEYRLALEWAAARLGALS